jgi:hypothetical protein
MPFLNNNMIGILIQIIIGLFIWFVLPTILQKGTKSKPVKKFISLTCLIIGLVIIIYGVIRILERILNFDL